MKQGTKPEYDNRNVCSCFFRQKKTSNINHWTPGPSLPDYSTKFTSNSPKTSSISSAGDKEATEDNAVSLSTVSLTLQHWLNVICSGHLSDTQHPVSLHGKEVFLKHPFPERYHLNCSTCPGPALGHGYVKVCPAPAHTRPSCSASLRGRLNHPKPNLI